LFSKANTLEDFEKSLNIENNNVNNLDLNLDGKIDYIRVIDRMDKKAHAITLQAIVGDNDFQDIAVTEIEQKSADNAIAQIVGDEDIYGQELYVEANPDNSIIDDNGQLIKKGPSPYAEYSPIRIYFNVWAWPCVQYMLCMYLLGIGTPTLCGGIHGDRGIGITFIHTDGTITIIIS